MNPLRAALPNGLTVLIEHVPQSDVVAIVTQVRAGYFDEPDDVVGIAHVVEHMFFKGTSRFGVGAIAKATKAAGGYLNAHTIYDHTSYYTVLPASAFSTGLEIQADAYANSVIDAEELSRELEVIIQEAKRKADNPSAVATETLYELLYDRHRIRRWRIGREHDLRRLTREAVYGFYRAFYQPSNTVLAIAGGIAPEAAVREVERLYGGLRDRAVGRSPGPEENGADGFRYRELAGDLNQTQLRFGWRAVPLLHPAAPPLELAAAVLASGRASRLYRAIRDRELASSVGAHNYTLPDLGVFTLHLETQGDRTLDAARAAWAETLRLREEQPAEHELERAKRLYESRWLRGLETVEGRANYLAAWEALGGWELGSEFLQRVLAVTPAGLQGAVHDRLQPERAAMLVYRPHDSPLAVGDADAMWQALELRPPPTPSSTPALPGRRIERQSATMERQVGAVRVYRTTRGLPLLVVRRPGLGFVYAGIHTGAGAAADPIERAGLTLLLARTAMKGTGTRSAAQIAEEAEHLGGTIAAVPAGDAVGWAMAVPAAAAGGALELLGDIAQRPEFPIEAVEVERTIALSDLGSLRDNMFSYPIRLMTQAAFGTHRYAIPTLGTEEGLHAVSRADLAEAHRDRLLRGSGVVAIVADADPDELAALAAGAFSELTVGDVPAHEAPFWNGGNRRTEERAKAQTAVAIAFPGPGRRDPDRHAMELIATIASGLGGRFFDELRDRQSLAYTVHAFSTARPLAGVFGTYIATSPEQEEAARDGLLREVRRLWSEPPTSDELHRAREYAIGTELIRRESGSALLSEVIDAWLFGELEEIEGYESAVRAVTRQDLERVVAEYLDTDRAALGVVRGRSA